MESRKACVPIGLTLLPCSIAFIDNSLANLIPIILAVFTEDPVLLKLLLGILLLVSILNGRPNKKKEKVNIVEEGAANLYDFPSNLLIRIAFSVGKRVPGAELGNVMNLRLISFQSSVMNLIVVLTIVVLALVRAALNCYNFAFIWVFFCDPFNSTVLIIHQVAHSLLLFALEPSHSSMLTIKKVVKIVFKIVVKIVSKVVQATKFVTHFAAFFFLNLLLSINKIRDLN